ncbi:MAG: outer membrane beta-barrel protein [Desulfobacterota bacterium]|nr:outer membrane beta-barrel protein [Thermodesulfobacteriota bacterium]
MRRGLVLVCAVLSLMLFLPPSLSAQQGGRISVGNLKVIPSLTLEEVYDDNIYLASGINDTNEKIDSDWIFHVMPGLMLDYTLEGRGYVRAGYLGDYAYYADFDQNDWKNHKVLFDFDYQAPGGLLFGLKNVWVDAADPYGADNQFGLGVPQTKRWYDDFNTKVGYNFGNQFRAFLYYDYYKQDYDLESDFSQDCTMNQFGAGLQMHVASKTWGFIRYHYGYRDYFSHPDGSGVTDQNDADFDFNRVSTGLVWDSGAKFSGELNFGYEWRNHDNEFDSLGNRYDDRDTWVAATRVNYFATSTTTFSLSLIRALRDTGSNTYQYYTDTGIKLGVAQVFLTRFTLTAEAGYALYEYNAPTDPTKEADNYLGSLGVSYKVQDWLIAGLAYTYLKQDSNYPEDDYKDNRFIISLRAAY